MTNEAKDITSYAGSPFQRTLQRRELDLGDRVRCWVVFGKNRVRIKLVDISLSGLGVVTTDPSRDIKFEEGDDVFILFVRGDDKYQVHGEVVHIRRSSSDRQRMCQVGIRLERNFLHSFEEYQRKVNKTILTCKTYIRPQIGCDDPFYFLEHLYFQINGFSSHGIDVVSSIRNCSLLPGQPLHMQLFVPGRGAFRLVAKVSEFLYRANSKRLHMFFEYQNVDKKMLEAISEYLLLFAEKVTTNRLRGIGFPIGDLARAIQVSFDSLTPRKVIQEGLARGVLGIPTMPQPNFDDAEFAAQTKGIICKIGPGVAARADLTFVLEKQDRSKFRDMGHKIPKRIEGKRHVEITNFFISPKVVLSDFFMNFVQHTIRIAAQKQVQYVLVEAAQQLAPIIEKIGFRATGSTTKHFTKSGREVVFELYDVRVENVLRNFDERVEPQIWNRVYSELNEFLAKPSPYEHGQARPYFVNQDELKRNSKKQEK